MIPALVLGVCLLIGLILLSRWFVSADPKALARGVKVFAVIVGAGAVLFLAATGRLGVAMGLAAFLLPMILRWRAVMNRLKTAAGPSPGRTSDLTTDWLSVSLHHDSGRMAGSVRQGRFAGQDLDSLSLDDLLDLLDEVRGADAESATVLEAYLDRTHGMAWREAAEGGGGAGAEAGAGGAGPGSGAGSAGGRRGGGAMTRDEALAMLGLDPGAGPDEIKDAHRRLMMKLHPDHGGSDYLAAKLNEAKEILLGR